jgi:hypothetical protein
MPLGPATGSGRGTATYNGLRSVYVNVTGTGTIADKVTLLAARSTNIRVKFDPPVPSLINTNFTINNGITVRMAETFDNGSTYLLVTTPRNDGKATYTLTVNRAGTNPAYTFNKVDLTYADISPLPEIFTMDSASFIIKPTTKFILETADAADLAEARGLVETLASTVRRSTGYDVDVVTTGETGIRDISFKIIPKSQELRPGVGYATATDAGYALEIGIDGAYLNAYTPAGLVRGIRTLLQLLPKEIQADSLVTGVDWVMTYASIIDYEGSKMRIRPDVDGTVTATYYVFNPNKEKEMNIAYIIAAYDENGKLLSFKQEVASVPAYGFDTFQLTIPDGAYTHKAYLWDAGTYVPIVRDHWLYTVPNIE